MNACVPASINSHLVSAKVVDMLKVAPIPKRTSRAAQAIFGSNNFYIALGNRLADILSELEPKPKIGSEFKRESAVPLLPLLTLFQYMESLTDGQAVEALHLRLDWKYALHLPLDQPRIPAETLCQYRKTSLHSRSYLSELQELLDRLATEPALGNYIKKPLDAESMIMVVCALDRLSRVEEAMRRAIEGLTNQHPDWLRRIALPHWYIRYYHTSSLLETPALGEQPDTFSREIGEDAHYLLERVDHANAPGLQAVEGIQELRAVWQEQFRLCANGSFIFSPHCASCSTIPTGNIQINP